MHLRILLLALLLAVDLVARAGTYYISYGAGSDANPGTRSAPWQRHPFMRGFAGRYTHAAGDRFIFRGGDTWPVTCFQLQVTQGGTSAARDYYGVDQSWYAGASWKAPLFDFQHTAIASGYLQSAGVYFNGAGYVTVDGLDLANHRGTQSSAGWGAATVAIMNAGADCITFTNCLVHDWDLPLPLPADGDSDGTGGIINFGGGGGSGCIVTHCTFHQANVACKTGIAVRNIGLLEHSELYQTPQTYLGGGTIRDNHFHHLPAPSATLQHGNCIEAFSSTDAFNNRIHDLDGHVAPMLISPGFSGGYGTNLVYNNLMWNTGIQTPIGMDTAGGDRVPRCGLRAYNNTVVGDGYLVRVGDRTTNYAAGLLDVRNNHFIGSATPIGYNDLARFCGKVSTVIIANNLVHTAAEASAAGYTVANGFRPTSSSSPTVGAGQDLGSVFNWDIDHVARSGAWDAGAYQWSGGGAPPPLPTSANTTPAPAASLAVKPVCAPAEPIVVTFANASGNAKDWIGVYSAGAAHTNFARWLYTDGTQTGSSGLVAGSVTFPGLTNAGNYEVRLFPTNSYQLAASAAFSVVPSGSVQLETSSCYVEEASGIAAIRVQRSGGSGPATVTYATADETAIAGVHYTATAGSLTWSDGDMAAKTVAIPLQNAGLSGWIRLRLALSNPTGATLGSNAVSTITILGSGRPYRVTPIGP